MTMTGVTARTRTRLNAPADVPEQRPHILARHRNQDAEDKLKSMASKKYDYSDELPQSAEPASEPAESSEASKNSETDEATAVSVEEMRRQWLEQRNDTLANEFHKLKPEIADAHRQLKKLVEVSGAFAGTILNLHELLKSSFPIRFTDADKQVLQNELHAIADNAISHIRNERKKANRDIHRKDNRISMTQATFWIIVILLLGLSAFLISALALNRMIIHSALLARLVFYIIGLLDIGITLVIIVCWKLNNSQ